MPYPQRRPRHHERRSAGRARGLSRRSRSRLTTLHPTGSSVVSETNTVSLSCEVVLVSSGQRMTIATTSPTPLAVITGLTLAMPKACSLPPQGSRRGDSRPQCDRIGQSGFNRVEG